MFRDSEHCSPAPRHAAADRHLAMRNLERAEDIAAAAMDAGIEWRWTTFPEFRVS